MHWQRKKSRSHRVSMAHHFLGRKRKTVQKPWHGKHTLNRPTSTVHWPASGPGLSYISLSPLGTPEWDIIPAAGGLGGSAVTVCPSTFSPLTWNSGLHSLASLYLSLCRNAPGRSKRMLKALPPPCPDI